MDDIQINTAIELHCMNTKTLQKQRQTKAETFLITNANSLQ